MRLKCDPRNAVDAKVKEPRVQTRFLMAERKGFEPPEACTSTVFKTAAFDRSAISPFPPRGAFRILMIPYSIISLSKKFARIFAPRGKFLKKLSRFFFGRRIGGGFRFMKNFCYFCGKIREGVDKPVETLYNITD